MPAITLPAAIEGARKRSLTITWKDTDDVAIDLTGATITGKIKNMSTGVTASIDGTLALVTAASGIFSWTFGAVDVGTVGFFKVQFIATYAGALTNKTFIADWEVKDALDV
jgi:hypothetical protein